MDSCACCAAEHLPLKKRSLKIEQDLRQQLVAQVDEVERLDLHTRSLERQLAELKNSTSWKVTKPIRLLGEFLGSKNSSKRSVRG